MLDLPVHEVYAPLHRKKSQIKTLLDISPNLLGPFDHDDNGYQSHHHEITTPIFRQHVTYEDENHHCENGPFDSTDSSDNNPLFLAHAKNRGETAIARFYLGVMPPGPMLGRS